MAIHIPAVPMRRCVVVTAAMLAMMWCSPQAGLTQSALDCPKETIEFRRVVVGELSLNVGCQGDADSVKPTLILLHGFPEYGSAWQTVASILAKKYRVVLPDQRGYNLSDKPADPSQYQLHNLVGDVAALIDVFSPNQPVVLVGHDLGGLVAYVAASQLRNDRIAGVAIVNAPHPNVYQQLFLADLAKLPAVEGQLAASWYIPTLFPADACPLPGFCPHAIPEAHYSNPDGDADLDDPDVVDYANLIQLVAYWGGASLVDQPLLDAWNRTPGETPDTHLTSMLNWYRAIVPLLFGPLPDFSIHVPTLILWGARDVTLIEANIDLRHHPAYPGVRTIDDYIPDLQIRLFADGGHFIQHERPIEMAAEIKSFVDQLFAHSHGVRD